MDHLEIAIEQMLTTYLSHLPADELTEATASLKNIVRQKTLTANQALQQTDGELKYIYFVYSGFVRCFYFDANGNEVTHFFMKKNDFCYGELMIRDLPVYLYYETISDCEFLYIPIKSLSDLMHTSDTLKSLYISVLENVLRYKMLREHGFLMQNATERYINFSAAFQEIEKIAQQSHIASYLGITPVSLSRIRRALRKEVPIHE